MIRKLMLLSLLAASTTEAQETADVGVSFLIKRSRGALRLEIHRSRSPSMSQSTLATARPSSAKSRPDAAETFANLPPASGDCPVFRKQQFRSRPLNERPCIIIDCKSSKERRAGSVSVSSAESNVCDTTCRQKKLHKSPVSDVVK